MFTVPVPFPQLLLLTMMSHGMEYTFGSSLLAVFPFQLLAHPSLLSGGGGVEKREKLMLCKHCSATGKHWCVINTASVTNPKYSSIQVPTKEITFPARFSQLLTCLESVNWLLDLDHNTVRTVFEFSST